MDGHALALVIFVELLKQKKDGMVMFNAGTSDLTDFSEIHLDGVFNFEIVGEALESHIAKFLAEDVRVGGLVIYADGRDPEANGFPLRLPRRQREVLDILAARAGRWVPNDFIVDTIYGLESDISVRVIDTHICRLRQVLTPALGFNPIETQNHVGYRLVKAPPAMAEMTNLPHMTAEQMFPRTFKRLKAAMAEIETH